MTGTLRQGPPGTVATMATRPTALQELLEDRPALPGWSRVHDPLLRHLRRRAGLANTQLLRC